ncbi:MAG: anti-phage dCTP deaminase [Bauldia litoralis]
MVNKSRKTPSPNSDSITSSIINNPELIFGIVGPIGVDLDPVISGLKSCLKDVDYNSHLIHITDHMQTPLIRNKIDESSYFRKYMSLIKYANAYRKKARHKAALAGLSVFHIRKIRGEISSSPTEPALGNAFIIRQFKRPEEISLMRRVYGRKFIQISVYGGELDRRAMLMQKIQSHDPSPKSDSDCESQAITLIDVDNNQIDDDNGQRISDVFHLGDVFVDGIDSETAYKTIKRFIRAFFGDNTVSPNKDEYGLYTATASALRSVDLSRQVGAAIFSDRAEVISLGCNEVPRAGGGTYWTDDESPLFRDVERENDANQLRKIEIIYDLVERLSSEKYLTRTLTRTSEIQEYVDQLLDNARIKEAQIMDIIEYGRMIHAEMSAICDASRLGRSTIGATLFCTTFPCHLCAKHIVAAGINRVVFLEPYPKSYAKKLHNDSITFDPKDVGKVLFQAFIGISPRRYRDIFEKRKRKDDQGKLKIWYEDEPTPMIEDRSSAYIENEAPFAVVALGKLYGSQPQGPTPPHPSRRGAR